jgi:hypothetical protein
VLTSTTSSYVTARKIKKGTSEVNEFLEALKTELESIFREEIRVYVDIDPHHDLLEAHDVESSLLSCHIFK